MNHQFNIYWYDEFETNKNPFKTVDVDLIYPYKSTLEVGIIKSVLSGGKIVWRDIGSQYDKYSTEFSFETDQTNAQIVEQSLKNPDRFAFSSYYGFYPFAPLFIYNKELPIVLEDATIDPVLDTFGNINKYKFKAIPAIDNISTYLDYKPSSYLSPCYVARTSWWLDDLPLPYPVSKFKVDLNTTQSAFALNSNFSAVSRFTIDNFETVSISVELDIHGAGYLLNNLQDIGSKEMVVTGHDIFAIFGQQYVVEFKLQLVHVN